MRAEIRPELPDSASDTGGIRASVSIAVGGLAKLGQAMLVTGHERATVVTGAPDAAAAPFAEQHDDTVSSQPTPKPHHELLGWRSSDRPMIAEAIKMRKYIQLNSARRNPGST